MKIKQLVSLTLTFIAIMAGILWFSGQQTARANSGQTRHKVVAPTGVFSPNTAGVTLLQDYGSYHLWLVSDDALARLPERSRQQVTLADEMDYLLFDARPFNTQQESLASLALPDGLTAVNTTGGSLHLIQFVGPIKSEWLTAVEATGAALVHYVAHNGYMVWADDASRARLDALAAEGDFLQFSALHQPYFKLGPSIRERLTSGSDPAEVVPVVIQIYNNQLSHSQTPELIKEVMVDQIAPWSAILAFENVVVSLPAGELAALARQPDVVWVGERFERELLDEVQNQIIAGNLDGSGTGPSGPGYLAWLNGFGVSTNPADYPIVDVTDDGIGNGTVNSNDETFHVLGNIANATRLAYVDNCTNSPSGEGVDGHGHINTSIVGGYDTRSGFPFRDPGGFQRGMGVSPYGRMGGVRIFDPGFDLSACGGTDTGLIKRIQDNGPRISSNSWGCSGCAGSYDDSSQAFDVGVRDADLTEAGNQELTFIFAAGNSGPGAGTVGTPGNGKNMITVGASENDRPSDEDGSWTDGCGIGPTGADNAMDVISFSSRGPSPGGRVKPEIIAPGTHIQGTASTNAGYTGNSVCDQYRPSGQTEFAASSGTSHSTPAVSGVASLYYYWLENEYGITPSPALMKAYLTAHPTYLTGVSANDTLPSNSQGYGMPNIGVGLDDSLRAFVNQEVVFDNSGETWMWDGSVADPSRPVRIVMAYTDAPGAIGTSPEVNNLNLSAVIAGNTYLGNEFSGQWSVTGGTADNDNNYEAIFLPAGTTGPIQITVTGFNIAGDGVPNSGDGTDQDFALVCYNCTQGSDFTLSADPNDLEICTPDDAVYTINVGSVLGFNDTVTLSAMGNPAGTTTNFSVNGQPAPYTSTLTIGNTGAAAAGSYSIDVVGVAPTSTHTTTVGLDVFTSTPGAPTLLTPANGATNVDLTPTFTWNAASQGNSYYLEVATDFGFSNVVYTTTTNITSHTLPGGNELDTSTDYYWRVRSSNLCGTGNYSAIFSFTTEPAPGDCSPGTTPTTIFSEDMESGAPGWTHSSGVGVDTWALSSSNPHSGSMAYHADDVSTVSDQYLVSPAIVLPAGQAPLTLQFWNYQELEDRTGGCYDGAVLEVSDNGGSSWIRLESELLTDPYDGPISTNFSNPLGGQNAWCGDPQPYLESIVDIDAFAGDTVQFRFRLATDSSVSRPGWDIDDVVVQSCDAGAQSVSLSADQTAATVLPGDTFTYTLQITNTGSVSDTYDLSASGNNWTTEVTPAVVSLDAGNSAVVWVAVTVDAGAAGGDTDSVLVTAVSQSDPAVDDAVVLSTTAETVYSVTAMADDDSLSGDAGTTVTYTVHIHNTGNTTDMFNLSLGASAWTTTLSTSSVNLAAGASTMVMVWVDIPGGAVDGDNDTVTLTATSAGDNSVTATVDLTTTAGPEMFFIYLPVVMKP